MGLVQGVVDGFIITMGITPPSADRRRGATIFIASALAGTVVGVVAIFGFMVFRVMGR